MINAVLTIDDIASKNTPALVDYLVEKGIKALMFAVGTHVEKYPENVIYALGRGMIVGNHSYSHPNFAEISFSFSSFLPVSTTLFPLLNRYSAVASPIPEVAPVISTDLRLFSI